MKIQINKTRKKLVVDLQSACNESVNGFDIMFNRQIHPFDMA